MKLCTDCKEFKEPKEFYPDKRRKDGRSCYCRSCMKERSRKYYQRQKLLARYRKQNRERAAKKRKGGECYTLEEWHALCERYGNKCLCCGQQVELTADHIVPLEKDGTNGIDNIQPLCRPCNSSKGIVVIDYRARVEV